MCFSQLEKLATKRAHFLVLCATGDDGAPVMLQLHVSCDYEVSNRLIYSGNDVLRTRRLIERRSVTDDHVFGPWADLMALSDEDFSAQATVKTKEWQTSGKRGGSNEWNSLVVAWCVGVLAFAVR